MQGIECRGMSAEGERRGLVQEMSAVQWMSIGVSAEVERGDECRQGNVLSLVKERRVTCEHDSQGSDAC